jgi:hypothetical protein
MTDDHLTPSQLGAFLGLRERATRGVLSDLEALGFKLEPTSYGGRRCPAKLAAAVKAARAAGHDVASLRLNPALHAFLALDARGVEPDPLDVLIFAAAELAIAREVIGEVTRAVEVGVQSGVKRPFSWRNSGLPDPKVGL